MAKLSFFSFSRPGQASPLGLSSLRSMWRMLAALSALIFLLAPQAWAENWSAAGNMITPRYSHTATLLGNGKVLVTGGWDDNGNGFLSSAELYDPSANAWSSAGRMALERKEHTATLLRNGKVLVTGGHSPFSRDSYSGVELYDPSTNTWSAAGSMAVGRYHHTATLLNNGKVLVTGGYNIGYLSSAELYDPSTNTWSAAGSMAKARYWHSATLLNNGKVLVTGGMGDIFTVPSPELYDPSTNTWSQVGDIPFYRDGLPNAALLKNGKVMVIGLTGYWISSVKLYDPSANTWSSAPGLVPASDGPGVTVLNNGKVLAVGGEYVGNAISSAELYDPDANIWSTVDSLATARKYHTATLLSNGKVLVTGGWNSSSGVLGSAELYSPSKTASSIQILNLTPAAPLVGQTLTAKVQVSASVQGLPQPTGVVTVTDGNQSCSFTLPATMCSVPLLSPGAHSLTASYSGDANYDASSTLVAAQVSVQADPSDSDGDGLPNTIENLVGLNPNTKDNNIFADTTPGRYLFVMQQFRDILFRETTPDVLAYADSQMQAGVTRNQVIQTLVNTEAANSQIKPLARIFTALFGSLYANSSINDFAAYAKAVSSNGLDLNSASANLTSASAFSSMSDSDFAGLVLTNVLGRSPSAQELSVAATAISTSSRGAWLKQQSELPAFVSATENKVFFEWVYLSLSRKVPTAQGEQYWLSRLNANGNSARVELVDAFLGTLLPNYSGAATAYYNRFMPAL